MQTRLNSAIAPNFFLFNENPDFFKRLDLNYPDRIVIRDVIGLIDRLIQTEGIACYLLFLLPGYQV